MGDYVKSGKEIASLDASEGLQIKAGIEPGTLIVTRGVNRMEEGMRVRLLD